MLEMTAVKRRFPVSGVFLVQKKLLEIKQAVLAITPEEDYSALIP